MAIPTRSRSSSEFHSARSALTDRFLQRFQRYVHDQMLSGVFLLLAATIAIIWANSRWSDSYLLFNRSILAINLGSLHIHHSVNAWINDGLMALFFFLVGLEIKMQMVEGELQQFRKALLPIVAALGGMVVPALIYAGFNSGLATMRGWGIPVATDIAFALGVLAILGNRVPVALRIFLLTLATVDDIGGILVIALFYSSTISWAALGAAGVLAGLIYFIGQRNVHSAGPYCVLGVALWIAMFASGVHPTIAGVVVGLLIPAHAWVSDKTFSQEADLLLERFKSAVASGDTERSHENSEKLMALARYTEPLSEKLQRVLSPWVNWIVLPIFAFSNAGVVLASGSVGSLMSHPVAYGVFFGLLAGKFLGILGFSWVAVKLKLVDLPVAVKWPHMIGTSILAGIGFTVSLFITQLALNDDTAIAAAKLAVLSASLFSAVGGYAFLRFVQPK